MPGKRKIQTVSGNDISDVERAPKRQRRVPGRRGALSAIMSAPMDVIYEIFTHVMPLDLLRLSRTSRALRNLLLRRETAWLWRSTRERNSIPEPFPTMSEPAFADLLFEQHCQLCGAKAGRIIIWSAFVRCCRRCLVIESSPLLPAWNILPAELLAVLPHLDMNHSPQYDRWRFGGRLYLKRYADRMVDQYLSIPAGRSKAWVAQTVETYERAYQHIPVCEGRMTMQRVLHEAELENLKSRRRLAILKELEKLGWDPRLLSDERVSEHRLVYKPQILTERVWANIKPRLELTLRSIEERMG
ncbi:hypothetical protein PM082_000469 [Marasmius tenuissimus]|nr:hypothetical protein PM082_000469 [Marasmius tenuissimus]